MPKSKSNNLVIIGFKAVGKTKIGLLLAKELEKEFIDLDKILEQQYQIKTGASFNFRQIYQQAGPVYFRRLEQQALKSLIKKDNIVLAVGGGTPLGLDNQKVLKQIGKIIYLQCQPEILFQRMMTGGRPAFLPKGQDVKEAFNELLKKREPIYHCLADITVDNSLSAEKTLLAIIKQL